jgi:hypothetical protein
MAEKGAVIMRKNRYPVIDGGGRFTERSQDVLE